jgi:selenophosphate synthetase-related protein
VLELCRRWEVRARVVGRVTEGGALRILDGEVVAGEVPAASLHEDAPLYRRPLRPRDRAGERDPASLDAPSDAAADLLGMLADPAWVWGQYDHQLFLNTVAGPGGDGTVLRLKHPVTGVDTGRALALTTDGNHRWCAVAPRTGTARVVAESVLNLACVGARPLALVNCLNFGNPEHPEVMWELSEAIDGMAEACRAFDLPVVGGNVSLYNETRGRDIDPTPVVGVLGVVDALERRPPGRRLVSGGQLLVLGPDGATSLAGSRWAWQRDAKGGALPALDLPAVAALAGLVRELVGDDMLQGLHDVADGGLSLAVAEMVAASEVGAELTAAVDHVGLFGESPDRVLLCVEPGRVEAVVARAAAAGIAAREVGVAGGDRLRLGPSIDVAVAAWSARGAAGCRRRSEPPSRTDRAAVGREARVGAASVPRSGRRQLALEQDGLRRRVRAPGRLPGDAERLVALGRPGQDLRGPAAGGAEQAGFLRTARTDEPERVGAVGREVGHAVGHDDGAVQARRVDDAHRAGTAPISTLFASGAVSTAEMASWRSRARCELIQPMPSRSAITAAATARAGASRRRGERRRSASSSGGRAGDSAGCWRRAPGSRRAGNRVDARP